jgi:hypothetical protein
MAKQNKTVPDLSRFHFTTFFISMEYPLHLLGPVKRDSRNEKDSELSFQELGSALGMDIQNETVKSSLERQQKRFNVYKRLYVGFSWLGYLLILGTPAVILIVVVASLLNVGILTGSMVSKIILYALIFLITYIAFKAANRIVSVLLDRYYADTLSFVTCLYLLANLTKKNSLAYPKDRKQLLVRIRALRKYLILLPHQFATTNLPPNSLASSQFRHMAEFTEDKENQIIAPSANSQHDLFVELKALLEILGSGNYGEFQYPASDTTNATPIPSKPNGMFGDILKLLGTVLPLFLLLLMYLYPNQFSFLGLENKVIALISLAWLLLAIDANLKLGVVDRVSSLAKAFKDLA